MLIIEGVSVAYCFVFWVHPFLEFTVFPIYKNHELLKEEKTIMLEIIRKILTY